MQIDLDRARRGLHVPSLDGVRGLAILLVLGYHCIVYGGMAPDATLDRVVHRMGSIGWIGVDLFFVLSGFLITGNLLDSKRGRTFFRSFYLRRVLRIFPLYFAFLAAFLWILPMFRSMGPDFALLQRDQAWYWTYLLNVRIALDGWPKYPALAHFWTLSVEEQFYVAWPLVVYACRRETLARICAACMVIPLLARVGLVFYGHDPAAHVLTVTRVDALAMGAFLALRIRRSPAPPRFAKPILIACLLILGLMFAYHRALWSEIPAVGTWGLTIIALGSGSLIATLLSEPGPGRLSRFFALRWIRFLGKYSYGIYVLHHPLIIFLGQSRFGASEWPRLHGSQMPGQLLVTLAGATLSIAAAVVSWHLLEAPFLRLKRFFPYAPAAPRSS